MWHHQDYLRCGTSMIAFMLFVRLFTDNSLNFYKSHEPNELPMWQKFKLSLWADGRNGETQAYKAYKALLEICKLLWEKVAHMRKQGIESASKRGCTEDEIGTLSKHVTRKIAHYETELHPVILLVLSGFTKKESYFVPRTHLQLPYGLTEEHLVHWFFPRIDEWREQQADPTHGDRPGDHNCAAYTILWTLLPWLSLVIFQDGIYWLRDFPNHEATRLLLYVLPDWYSGWARWARDEVENIANSRDDAKVANLNAAAQSSYDSLSRKVQKIHEDTRQDIRQECQAVVRQECQAVVRQECKAVVRQVCQIAARFVDRIQTGNRMSPEETSQMVDHMLSEFDDSFSTSANNTTGIDSSRPSMPPPMAGIDSSLRPSMPPPTARPPLPTQQEYINGGGTEQSPMAQPPLPTQAAETINGGGTEPFPVAMPKTMVEFLLQHQTFNIGQYDESRTRRGWPNNWSMAYSRRKYLYRQMLESAGRMRNNQTTEQRLPAVAQNFDNLIIREGLTGTYQLVEYLKKKNPPKSRKRKNQVRDH